MAWVFLFVKNFILEDFKHIYIYTYIYIYMYIYIYIYVYFIHKLIT